MEWGGSISITITIGAGHQWGRCGDTVTPCPGCLPLVRPHIRNPAGSPMLETISVSNPIPTVPRRGHGAAALLGRVYPHWAAAVALGCRARRVRRAGRAGAPRHKQRRNVRKGCHQHQHQGHGGEGSTSRGPEPGSSLDPVRSRDGIVTELQTGDGSTVGTQHPASSSDTSLVLAAWTGTSNHNQCSRLYTVTARGMAPPQ